MDPNARIDVTEDLRRQQGGDGGFGPRAGLPSEPEPTALAALALAPDAAAVTWLGAHARRDGSFGLSLGPVDNDSATAYAALALPAGPARDRAIRHMETAKAERTAEDPMVPHDASTQGWSWTRGAFGWTEPTARALLALRVLRPDSAAIADGLATLADRQCSDGGWNYGNPVVLGEELPGFAQTTAAALIGLQGAADEIVQPGLAALRALWRAEHQGALSLAMATAALRLHEDPDAREAEDALQQLSEGAGFLGDTVSLAWAAIATGPGLDRLVVRR
jgi:hypothetical protein